jgi:hypothetical protein
MQVGKQRLAISGAAIRSTGQGKVAWNPIKTQNLESRSPDISVSEIDPFFSQRSSATACLRRRRVPGMSTII